MDTILLDHQLQETLFFEDPSFPIKYYVDNLNQWADGQVPLHWHLGYECFSAACQEIEVQVESERLRLRKGDSILIGAGQLHSYRMTEPGQLCLCPNIVFTDEILAPMTSSVFQKYFRPVLGDPTLPYMIFSSESPWQEKLSEDLFSVYSLLASFETPGDYGGRPCPAAPARSDCPELEIHQRLLEIMKSLYLHKKELPRTASPRPEQKTQIRLQKMLRYIQAHFSEEITLEQLAESAGISRSEAGRCFRTYYAQSPMGYVTLYRLKCAQELLAKSSLSVSEIAYRCGFKDSGYFVKVFRKHLKQTPSEYRKTLGLELQMAAGQVR